MVGGEWRRGGPITEPSFCKAFRLGSDVEWFAFRVLDATAWATCDAAWAMYDPEMATTLAIYEAEIARMLVPLLRAALEVR